MKKMRLRRQRALVAFIRRTTDKYVGQSIRKGFIRVPDSSTVVDGPLFLFDDVSPLGISYPAELVDALKTNNQPLTMFNAQELAEKLVNVLPQTDDLAVFDGGGILAYLFLKRAGYNGKLTEKSPSLVRVDRRYVDGRPVCTCAVPLERKPALIIDDILASGQTVVTAMRQSRTGSIVNDERPVGLACLLASTNVPKGSACAAANENYRERQKSTVPGIAMLYCSQLVNGAVYNGGNSKPAILSLRYLLTKAVDNQDYREGYLTKKFGGPDNAARIVSLLARINRNPLDLLRKDPALFLTTYGAEGLT